MYRYLGVRVAYHIYQVGMSNDIRLLQLYNMLYIVQPVVYQ